MKRLLKVVFGVAVAMLSAGFGGGLAAKRGKRWAKAALAKSPRHGEWVT